MLIFQSNQNHRYHLVNHVEDNPVDLKQQTGMAGYSKCLGWLLAKIHIAICFNDNGRQFYLNRKSAIKYVNRHESNRLLDKAHERDICGALFDIALSAQSPTERPQELKPSVEESPSDAEKAIVPSSDEVFEAPVSSEEAPGNSEETTDLSYIDEPADTATTSDVPAGNVEIVTHEEISTSEEQPQAAPLTAQAITPAPLLNVELPFPSDTASMREIRDWCDQATPERILENFENLAKLAQKRTADNPEQCHENHLEHVAFKEVLTQAFDRIYQCSTINGQSFNEKMNKLIEFFCDPFTMGLKENFLEQIIQRATPYHLMFLMSQSLGSHQLIILKERCRQITVEQLLDVYLSSFQDIHSEDEQIVTKNAATHIRLILNFMRSEEEKKQFVSELSIEQNIALFILYKDQVKWKERIINNYQADNSSFEEFQKKAATYLNHDL